MVTVKCKSCKKVFNKEDDIVVVDGNYHEAIHDGECYYRYLTNSHLNHIVSLEELIVELENE